MQFDAEDCDYEHDGGDAKPVRATVIASYVRRLSDVVSIGIGNARLRLNSFNQVIQDVLDIGEVSLTFSDRTVADLGIDQIAMGPYDERQRSDIFIDLLRQRTGL